MTTTFALSTSAYYMAEFHDDVTKQWMLAFNKYNEHGFEKSSWKDYLEHMIISDKQNITVYMDPPDGFFGAKGTGGKPKDPNIKLQYSHQVGMVIIVFK